MNEKVEKLLKEIDDEVMAKVNAKVVEHDAEIKAKAQEAYDKAVEDQIADIKAGVEGEYAMARKYLESLKEKEVEAPIASAPVAPEAAQGSVI